MNPIRQLAMGAAQREAIQGATRQLEELRNGVSARGSEAAPLKLRLTARKSFELMLMVVIPSSLLLFAKPQLMGFWHSVMTWWIEKLAMPLELVRTGSTQSLEWLPNYIGPLVPGPITGLVTAAVVIGAFASTWWMSDRQVPLKYLVRTLCVVQGSALLVFMFAPTSFPYSTAGHLAAMLNAGFYLMMAMPALLALGWGVLSVPLHQKLLFPALMLLYFALMLPHKTLLHAVVIQQFSALSMPLLYLCFGAVFDLMVFVALYSWLASRAPAHALDSRHAL